MPRTDRARRRAERIHAINLPTRVPTPARKIRPRQGARLSPRELEVLRLLTESLGTKEIAAALGISARTVKLHIGNALAKSGRRDRCSLIAWFAQNGAPPAMPAKEEIELRSLVRNSVARIEAELAAVTCAIRDHVARMERELEGSSSPQTK